jgi:hypothetical protein
MKMTRQEDSDFNKATTTDHSLWRTSIAAKVDNRIHSEGIGSVEERQQYQEQVENNRLLRERLERIRKKRQRLQHIRDQAISQNLVQTQDRLESLRLERQDAMHVYQSVLAIRKETTGFLQLAQKWNVTNDCFHIWHQGPFGTINGLRLGSEVPPVPGVGGNEVVKVGATSPSNGSADMPPRRYMVFSSVSSSAEPTKESAAVIKISWTEINAALGLVALLLCCLAEKPHCGISFLHDIYPMGSTSKIGLRRGETVTVYNLCSDDSFSIFGKRNFNIALQTLIQCVADAAQAIQRRDRTIALPHMIDFTQAGDMRIGGLAVAFGVDGVEWTRAMKYLLTDLKWLVAYSAKHVDR